LKNNRVITIFFIHVIGADFIDQLILEIKKKKQDSRV